MLGQRIIIGLILIATLVGVVWLDGWLSESVLHPSADAATLPMSPLFCALPLTLVVMLLLIGAAAELGVLSRGVGFEPAVKWACFITAGLVAVPWLQMQYRLNPALFDAGRFRIDLDPTLIWLTGGLLGAILLVLPRKRMRRSTSQLAATVMIFSYIGLLGSFAIRIRCLNPGAPGAALLVFFIMTVKFNDIGAFFVGRMIGKHKLVPRLSPKKTIEGGIGAIVGAATAATVMVYFWTSVTPQIGPAPLTIPQALIFGVLMAFCGHCGDLIISAIKRDVGAKDSARLLPSFGGFLDIFDSPLFAAPIAWWWLTFQGSIGYN